MKLYATSDLHLDHRANRELFEALRPGPSEGLVLAGDVAETEEIFQWALDRLRPRWKWLMWVPGNHELWTLPQRGAHERGEDKYRRWVELCRARGIHTPEDEYVVWPDAVTPLTIAPLFTLYDYSFAPDGMPPAEALEWARARSIVCTDEAVLDPVPYDSIVQWCRARVQATADRLERIPKNHQTVLINHYPLRYDLVTLPAIPRFSPWCGTRMTDDWHLRFRAHACVHGHLHVPYTHHRDGVRFEEVSFGYPRQWRRRKWTEIPLRRIL